MSLSLPTHQPEPELTRCLLSTRVLPRGIAAMAIAHAGTISTMSLQFDTDVPPHVRRVYILSGYRPLMASDSSFIVAAAKGVFTLHNETFNIWSHLLGVAWALTRVYDLMTLPEDAFGKSMPHDLRTKALLFQLSAIFCLGASVIAHTFSPILNHEASNRLWRIDSYGICVLIGGSWMPGLSFCLRCRPAAAHFYSVVIVVLLLLGAIGSATSETGRSNQTPIAERLRVGSLIAGVSFGLVPLAHFCLLAPADEIALVIPPILKMFVGYGIGFAFYVSGLPESMRPGSFDLRPFGSHFMWHLAVVQACRSYEGAVWHMLSHDDAYPCQGWDVE